APGVIQPREMCAYRTDCSLCFHCCPPCVCAWIGGQLYTLLNINAIALPIYLDDIKKPLAGCPTIRGASTEQNIKSFAALPLERQNQLIGVLFAYLQVPISFSAGVKRVLELFAAQAAIAIENTRLYNTVRNSEKKLSAIIEGIPIPTFVIDDQHIVTHWNTACAKLTGIPKDQVRNTKEAWRAFYATKRPVMADLVVNNALEEEIAEHYQDKYQQSALIEGAYVAEDFFPDFGKSGKWLFFTAAPLRDADKKITGAIETLQDFTERKQAEEKLKLINIAGQAFSSTLDMDEVISAILEQVRVLLDVAATSIWLIDTGTGELVCQEATGPKSDAVRNWRLEPGTGFVGTVAQSGESLIVSDTQSDERHFKSIEQTTNLKLRSILSIPLKARNVVIGVLQVLDRKVRRFDQTTLMQMEPLATSAAIAIENARLFKERAEWATQLERLYNVMSTILAESSDFDKVLNLIISSIKDIFQEASCGIRLYDSSEKKFTALFATDALGKGMADYEPRDEGTSNYIIDEWGKPFYAKDASVTLPNGRPAIRDEMKEMGIEAIAYFPLVSERNVIGMLYIDWNVPRSFSNDDRRILGFFANQAAVAIENARLYRELQMTYDQRVDDIAALQEINEAITTKEWDEIDNLIVRQAQTLTQAEYATLWIVKEEDVLVKREVYGRAAKANQLRIDEHSINGWVALTDEPYKCPDVSQDPHYAEWYEDVKSSITVPLRSDGKVIGTLDAESTELDAFTDSQLDLLQTLADQAAIAIGNARLFEQLQHEREDRVAMIREIGYGITAGVDLDQVLKNLLQRTLRLMKEASLGDIWLLDEATKKLRARVFHGTVEGDLKELDLGQGVVGQVAQSGEPRIVGNVDQDPHFVRFIGGTQSELAVPLLKENRAIGVLNVEHPQLDAFTPDDIPLLEAIASQVVIALGNARQYEQRNKDLAALQEINEAVVSKTHTEILDLIVKKAVEVMPGEYSELWLKEPDTDDLVLDAVWGLDEEIVQESRKLKAGTASINVQVAETGIPNICNDVRENPNFYPIYKDAQSSVTVPLELEDIVIGTLNVESSQLKAFEERHSQLLNSFADQAAIAIRNARHLTTRELALQVSHQVTGILDLKPLTQKAVELIHSTLGYFYVAIMLVDPLSSDEVEYFAGAGGFAGRTPEGYRQKIGTGMIGWVAQEGQSLLANDVSQESRYIGLYLKEETRSELSIPLKIGEKIVGVLDMQSGKPNAFQEEDIPILEILAGQLATAIENARLFDQLQEELQRSEALSELGKDLTIL
ncbi:MAG: GAF domain-containing protein, partial [Proteobacteria bacterium]|nr:GAF domain-containing protein [Pseudomonadota bacterium]